MPLVPNVEAAKVVDMRSNEAFDEAALLDAARSGDSAALDALIAHYQPRVLRFGLRMCNDTEDAQDVMQETLLAAARGIRQFRGTASLTTWLYTIARSFCIKKRRRSKFAPTHESSLNDDANREALRVAAPDRSPEQAALDGELEQALKKAIGGLEPMYREVLVLRDVEGLTAPEVAEVVGASVGAVKSRLHRARGAVKEALIPLLEPTPEARPQADCPDVVELFSRNLEGDISDSLCRDLQAHVDACPSCKQKCDAIGKVVQLCRTQPPPQVPEALRTAVSDAVRALQPNRPTGSFK